jgi:hypothetical protein
LIGDARILPNVGAEEGDWQRHAAEPRVAAVAELFAGLFQPPLPFAWLESGPETGFAWLVDEAAERWASESGLSLAGAPAAVVRQVHDKAFASRVSDNERLTPEPLCGLGLIFDHRAIEASGAVDTILERALSWPDWTGGRFTLKPRLGTSSRGRVGGVAGKTDEEAVQSIRSALPRLAERGGAILEPWLERRGDFSVQFHLGSAGPVLLGSLTQCTAGSGQVAGHRGSIDARGRVTAESPYEGRLVDAALTIALAAAEVGYRGPCGIDAFAFAGPDGETWLRPVVEFNARFTLGTVAVACTRRALGRARAELGLAPGRLVHFAFLLGPPAATPQDEDVLEIPLDDASEGPRLWLARTPDALDVLVPAA